MRMRWSIWTEGTPPSADVTFQTAASTPFIDGNRENHAAPAAHSCL
jgi:hypothetical protein